MQIINIQDHNLFYIFLEFYKWTFIALFKKLLIHDILGFPNPLIYFSF